MLDPFSAWARLFSAGLGLAQTNIRAAETALAAASVISTRTAMMRGGLNAPASDRDELARMVPEKVEAFSASATAVWRAWTQGQSAFAAEVQHWNRLALGGPSKLADIPALYARQSSFLITAIEAQARLAGTALAPVHRTAVKNARRLAR